MNQLTVEAPHAARERAAQPDGVRDDHIEYWLEIGGRTGDNAQDLTSCRLLLERLGQLPVARLRLIEQAHVLDGNHGLVGERGHKFDLLGRKWPRGCSCQGYDADAASVSEQWDAEHCAEAAESLRFMPGEFRIGQHVGNVHHSGPECDASGERLSARWNGMFFHVLFELGRKAVVGCQTVDFAVTQENE